MSIRAKIKYSFISPPDLKLRKDTAFILQFQEIAVNERMRILMKLIGC